MAKKKSSKGSKGKRATTAPESSYSSYIGKMQKQMFKADGVAIGKASVQSLNQMLIFLVDRLSVEAARSARYGKSSTLNMKAGTTANRLVIHGKLGKEADAFASAAVVRVVEATPKPAPAPAPVPVEA
tara:strand:- start:472 stop:855 length:384 start_codon:yes stop_codon:yes gene_type:complete